MENKLGKFIVFEGGEGSGKTTQARLLYESLKKEGRDVLLTKEPGGDDGVCKDIRQLLLNPKYQGLMSSHAELLLFEADRAQHVHAVIRPALEQGKIVISDRFEASTGAYQCGGRGLKWPEFGRINEFAAQELVPDFTFWIDIDPKIGLKRNFDASKRDRFEMEDIEFHNRVRKGFDLYFDGIHPKKYQKLNGNLAIAELHAQILETAKRLI